MDSTEIPIYYHYLLLNQLSFNLSPCGHCKLEININNFSFRGIWYFEFATMKKKLSHDLYGPGSTFFTKPLCVKTPMQIRLQTGHMIKYLLTKLGRAGWENIWLSVNLEPNIFPSGPPT